MGMDSQEVCVDEQLCLHFLVNWANVTTWVTPLLRDRVKGGKK